MIVAHLDLDAFFAAVEELENPALRDVPLIVGGDPHGRGVVATANYRARQFGIHSAMSCAEALRRCPQATFVRPRHSVYSQYSRAVWEVVRGVVPAVERTGLDEGYLDLAAVARDFGEARVLAAAVQTAVRGATSLSCSLGVGTSKVVAKVASDRRKPGGITVVLPGREAEFLAPFDLRLLPGDRPTDGGAPARGSGSRPSARSPRSPTTSWRRLLPGKVGAAAARSGARRRPARAREPVRERLAQHRGDVRAGSSPTARRCTPSCGGWPTGSASTSPARAAPRAR